MRKIWCALPLVLWGCGDKDDKEDSGDPGGGDTGEVTVTDADGDGYDEEVDCDDADAAINPGADEICDGLDNDCDALIDDEDGSLAVSESSLFYVDTDGDGYGTSDTTVIGCDVPDGFATTGGDCDDDDGAVSPGGTETCDDGIDNDCSLSIDCGDDSCTGDVACLAYVDELSHDWADVSLGGGTLYIYGGGFDHGNSGAASVTIGKTALTDVVVENDYRISATVPPGAAAGIYDVTVTNDNGSVTLKGGFNYAECLYAAKGRAGSVGDLFCIDPNNGNSFSAGTMSRPYTGLAFAPDGTLYGVTSNSSGDGNLYTIDPVSGVQTSVGGIYDSVKGKELHDQISDITFAGSRLIGWSKSYINSTYSVPVEIDTKTAVATQLMTGSYDVYMYGTNLAADASGDVYVGQRSNSLYSVDLKTGAATNLGSLSATVNYYNGGGATFHNGVFYGLDCNYGSSGACDLMEYDVKALTATSLGFTLPTGLDSLASPTP